MQSDVALFQVSDVRHLGRLLRWLNLGAGIELSKFMDVKFGHLLRNDPLGDGPPGTKYKRDRSETNTPL